MRVIGRTSLSTQAFRSLFAEAMSEPTGARRSAERLERIGSEGHPHAPQSRVASQAWPTGRERLERLFGAGGVPGPPARHP